jgi:hypothetical protein
MDLRRQLGNAGYQYESNWRGDNARPDAVIHQSSHRDKCQQDNFLDRECNRVHGYWSLLDHARYGSDLSPHDEWLQDSERLFIGDVIGLTQRIGGDIRGWS